MEKQEINYTQKEVEEIITKIFDRVEQDITIWAKNHKESSQRISLEYYEAQRHKEAEKERDLLIKLSDMYGGMTTLEQFKHRIQDHRPSSLWLNKKEN